MSVNLAHMAGNTNYEPNGMNCDIHVGYVPIASCRVVNVPRHVACSGRVGDASSVMDDLCPVNFAHMACSTNYEPDRLISIQIYHIHRCERSCNKRLVLVNWQSIAIGIRGN